MLFLDLNKAVGQVPSTGREAVDKRTAALEYVESFDQEYAGEGNSFTEGTGRKGSGTSVRDVVDTARDAADKDAVDRKLVAAPEDDEEETVPAETEKALNILKSLNTDLGRVVAAHKPNDHELSFLLSKGYSAEAVAAGIVKIAGPMRHEFNMWMYNNLNKSLQSLLGGSDER